MHGLHFRINRSRYYVAEFESLLATLKIGNIETWVAYDQFVTRGLKPAFDFIDGVGHRLLGLRARLQSVLEGIETSALVRQIGGDAGKHSAIAATSPSVRTPAAICSWIARPRVGAGEPRQSSVLK